MPKKTKKKPLSEKPLSLIIFFFVLFLAVLGSLFLFGVFEGEEIPETPVSCLDYPSNINCICPEGYIKVGSYPPFTCELESDIPSQIVLPIDTWEEAIAYTEWHLLGTNPEDGLQCTGEWAYRNPISGSLTQYGDPSDPELLIEVECSKPIEGGGQGVYRLMFHTADSCIFIRSCKDDLVSEKGLTCLQDNIQVDPDFTTCPLL